MITAEKKKIGISCIRHISNTYSKAAPAARRLVSFSHILVVTLSIVFHYHFNLRCRILVLLVSTLQDINEKITLERATTFN